MFGVFVKDFWRHLRRYLITGMLVWIPLIITAWVIWLVFDKLGGGLEALIENILTRLKIDYFRGLGFVVAGTLFVATGLLTRYLIGRRMIRFGENVLH